MLREFKINKRKERHIHINAVGIGDVITVSKGVATNWVLKDFGLEGIYELDFEMMDAVNHQNMYSSKSWYKICRNKKNIPILLRIDGKSVLGE